MYSTNQSTRTRTRNVRKLGNWFHKRFERTQKGPTEVDIISLFLYTVFREHWKIKGLYETGSMYIAKHSKGRIHIFAFQKFPK